MNDDRSLKKYMSPAGAWAFSIGTSIGWGSLVVTSSSYLSQAGPLGSVLGTVIGTLVMLLICRNYTYMMRCYPEAGGAYIFTREVFGYDQAFLTSWFLAMTYLAVLWANATSLPLFARIFLGGMFRVGKLYTIFGYEVYLGEALLSMGALLIIGFLCAKSRKAAEIIMIILAVIFTVGITVAFIGAIAGGGGSSMKPAYIPDESVISQIIKIAVITPWAFIGFESISHSAEEFRFGSDRTHRLLVTAVLSTAALYIMVTLLSVTAYPPEYDSWLSYIRDLGNLEGLKALPAFYAADHYLGSAGVMILMLSLLALVITSFIGNMTALSRLFYAMGRDRVLPPVFAKKDRRGNPSAAVYLVVGLSILIPFVGRTAIGWIVDVTTIGATLIYGLVSAATASMAHDMGDRREVITGRAGLIVMIALGAYYLFPNLVARGSLATETYFLFIVWSVLGFIFFRNILRRDKDRRFGSSVIVWVVLLALVLFIALIWMRQSMIDSNDRMLTNVRTYYEESDELDRQRTADELYIEDQMHQRAAADTRTMLMGVTMFAFALIIMLTNHSYMNRRSKESEMLANLDSMTGALNKHAWLMKEKELDGDIAAEGTTRDFSIVVCDVNGLKKINDTYGHKAGDEYICKAYDLIRELFQHSNVYRTGGDEFVLVLSGRDHAIRHELMTALHDRSVANISSGEVVISGGISDFRPGEDTGAHDAFARADTLMYEEKQLLKGLGSISREDAEEASAFAEGREEEPIINVSRQILVVEDEEVDRMMLTNILENGYDVIYAADGVEAMEQIREHRDDLALVLLDLNMPRMGGLEVLSSMKADQELQAIPVIVLTSDQGAEVECLHNGAADFIPKPYPVWEIIRARIDKCIELSESREIIQSTERDHLTRLFNFDYFIRYVKIYDQHYFDMLMDAIVVDVNHFHMVNERYGKAYGDSVLRRIGEAIRRLAREIGGVGCRRDADTFFIYCPHREDYQALLDKLTEGTGGDTVPANRVRLRMGVYSNVDKTLDIEQRFKRAGIAGDTVRNNYTKAIGIYDDRMHEAAVFRNRLIEDFHASISEKRFIVYFQPRFDIRSDSPVLASAEALVRWNHPEYGMLEPDTFISLLEENGLILELDHYVWNETASRIRLWKDKFGYAVPVSVNMSRIDMLMPNLKNVFRDILDTYGLAVEDIMLEVTESAYTEDSEQVLATARDLRGMGMGFRIEMDDFGTGYSSLGMLSHMPIDALKLDIGFVQNNRGGVGDERMIELIIDIADYLQVPVVAEGVETEEQYLLLKRLGCDLVQGFYFSRPVPEAEFEQILLESGQH